jgi:hypothetical protein
MVRMHITTSQDKSPAVVWKDEQNTQRRWNTIKTFQLKERIDLDRLKRIIRTASMRTEFKDDKAKAAHEADIKMLHVLKQQASKTGRYVVPYTLHTCGRYFPGTAELPRVGLASLPRKYRKPLCGEFDTDVDIENAHPTFLKRILEHENISFPLLGEYVTNRTEFCTDATPKETWLALLYGGKPRPGSGGRVNAFSQQAHSALEELFARPAFQTYHDQGKQKCQQKDLYGACDPLHSAFAYLMFECERECVALAMQKLTDKPYKHKISAVIHDGFHIANLHVPDEHLRAAEKHVKAESRYNFEIKLVKKDLTNFDASVLGTEDSSLLGGDAGNALRWLDYMRAQGHEFLRSGKDVHWYHPGQGIYGKDWGSWNTFATNCPCLDEEYQVSTGNQKMMREQIFANVESATSGEFHRRVFDSTHRRLAFQNGVYDFEKGELVDFSSNYLFDRKANVDYNPNLVELEKEVRQKLFVDIVGDEVGEYFIKLLARGLAGEYEDKAFVVLVGLGNSGLGTLTSALSRTFGPYVKNFNACALKAIEASDAAKAQSWMCDLRSPVRFAIANETPDGTTLSGDRIKTFSGGGDTITARQNHQDEYEFWLQCLPMIFANDIKYKGDAQTVARMKFIDALYRYLDGENYENEKGQPEVRKADPKLKGWLSREDVQTAFASLLLKAYEATKPVAPDAVRKSIAEWAENDDLCDRLNALFEKTNDPEDFLSFAKIQFKVQQDGCTVSKTLIGRALTKLGFEAKPKKISGRTVVGRTCIKERGEEE